MAKGNTIRYTDYFEIKGDVPFEDLDAYNDNKMYLDPHLRGCGRFLGDSHAAIPWL